jgi:hypothetical protein
MMRRRIFLGGIVVLVVLLLVLAATAPARVAYWAILGVVIWWAAPSFGAKSLPATVVRYVVVLGAAVVGIPFVVSSPHDSGFWVLLGGLVLILLPGVAAASWFYGQIRRLQKASKPPTSLQAPGNGSNELPIRQGGSR